MAKPVITIIGLGLTGAGIGAGLKREEGNFEVVGHDKEPDAVAAAKRQNAVDRTEWNLYRACDKAEMIILAIPLAELEAILKLLAADLRPGTLVMAVNKVMQPALDVAAKHIPDDVHFVAAHPILTGVGGTLTVRPDLFAGTPFCLASSVETDPSAIQLASDLVERIGAKPLFIDAQEHDGIIAGVELLPQFFGMTLMQTLGGGAGWTEARKLAGRQFAQSTEPAGSADRLFSDFVANKRNLLLRIDQLQEALSNWRGLLEEEIVPELQEEEHPLLTALKATIKQREAWEAGAFLKNWEEAPRTDAAETRNMFQQMFFGNLFQRRGSAEEKNDKVAR